MPVKYPKPNMIDRPSIHLNLSSSCVHSIYTDVSKAFDRVDTRLLIDKLKSYGIGDSFLSWLSSYFRGRTQSVLVGNSLSRPIPVLSGVGQGSHSGPLLFSLFFNDLPQVIRHSSVLMFADDVKLYKTIRTIGDCYLLQCDLDAFHSWLLINGLLFHRAILMSGSALSPWALVRDPARYARQVAKHAACPRDLSHTELLKCLREKPLELLLSTPVVAPEFTTAFGPSIDGVIIDTGLSETRPANNKDSHSYDYHTQNSPGRPPPPPSASENINEAIAAGGYGNAVLSNAIAKKAMVSKLTRYDLLLGVVKAEAFFTFTGDDIQYGIEPDRRSKILRTFVKNTYR
ncbi:hypothetical protein M8J77_009943 [Diaphorina citri]|nr:hypothetical protein M8J77_009943 [Diaphorina citri]